MSHPTGSIARRLSWEAALRAEGVLSKLRLGFCSFELARFLTLQAPVPWQGSFVNITALLIGIGFSCWMLRALRLQRCDSHTLAACTLLDCVVCSASLFQTSLWPSSSAYSGMLARPDVAAVLVVVYAAGYRLSQRLVLLSGGLHAVGLALLLAAEQTRHAASLAYDRTDVMLFMTLLACTTVLAVATATRTRELLATVEQRTRQLDTAEHEFVHIVRDQHDARSVLSAALLHAGLLARELSGAPADPVPGLKTLSERVHTDIRAARACLSQLGERSFSHLSLLHGLLPIDTDRVISACVAAARSRFPGLEIVLQLSAAGWVELMGGPPSLERTLLNLMSNAHEGDGIRAATKLWISTERLGARRLRLTVRDDGPGFPAWLLDSIGQSVVSTKQGGVGLGLYSLRRILEQSGGTLSVRNTGTGASVTLELCTVANRELTAS